MPGIGGGVVAGGGNYGGGRHYGGGGGYRHHHRGGGFWPGVAIGAGIGSSYGYYGSSPDYYDDDDITTRAWLLRSPLRPATIPWRIACRRTNPTIRIREPISATTGSGTPARNGMIS